MKNVDIKKLYKKEIRGVIKKLNRVCAHLEKYVNDTDKMLAGLDKFQVKELPEKA